MRCGVLAIIPLLALGACFDTQGAADELARQQARNVVNAEVARRFPGVDATPVTDCVINNASAQEILTIAGGAVTGNQQAATQTVATVLQRPETLQCATQNVLGGSLGAGLLAGAGAAG